MEAGGQSATLDSVRCPAEISCANAQDPGSPKGPPPSARGLYTGRGAAHLARGKPERLEPNPKRRIDDGATLLGGVEVPVRELLTAVLRRVAGEAARVAGPIGDLTLTHPAAQVLPVFAGPRGDFPGPQSPDPFG